MGSSYGPMGGGGFRRRARRRGLAVGAAVGAAAAKRHSDKQQPEAEPESKPDLEAELNELASLKAKNLISDDEYDAKRKQILGL